MTSRRQVVHESPTTWIDLTRSVILRNLIKPNQLIIRLSRKILILRGVCSIFRGEECSRISVDFGKVQERPGMAGEENSSMAGSGFFQNTPPRGMGW